MFFMLFYSTLFRFMLLLFALLRAPWVLQLENFIHDIQIVEKVFPLVLQPSLYGCEMKLLFSCLFYSLSLTHNNTTSTCHVWFRF